MQRVIRYYYCSLLLVFNTYTGHSAIRSAMYERDYINTSHLTVYIVVSVMATILLTRTAHAEFVPLQIL